MLLVVQARCRPPMMMMTMMRQVLSKRDSFGNVLNLFFSRFTSPHSSTPASHSYPVLIPRGSIIKLIEFDEDSISEMEFDEDSCSEMEFDEDSCSEMEFDKDSSSEMEFDEDRDEAQAH